MSTSFCKNSWSYTSAEGYSIKEDALGHWWLKKNGYIIANSTTPYPLLTHLLKEKLIPYEEIITMADVLQIPTKFIDSSLSELEEK